MFKNNWGLRLVLVYHKLIFYSENVCSKQGRGYFLVSSSLISIGRLILYYENCIQKSGGLPFDLFGYFSYTTSFQNQHKATF